MVQIYSTRVRACLSCVLYIMVLIYSAYVSVCLSCALHIMVLTYSTHVRATVLADWVSNTKLLTMCVRIMCVFKYIIMLIYSTCV